jgi:branched-chain amino acid transport system ATP-binding protein
MTAAESLPPLLAADHVSAGYGDLRVLADLTLQVRAGQVTALLGRNGAGKTTTLRCIAGLTPASGGQITFDGQDITRQPTYARIRGGLALCQENKRVFRRRSVRENLVLGSYGRRLKGAALRASLAEVYQLFPALEERAGSRAGDLSGGQQQMLAIGQALMTSPKLLMIDEPSAGLAPIVVTEVLDAVTTLKDTGLAILLSEQSIDAAARVADTIYIVDHGRTVAVDGEATYTELIAALRRSYLGSSSTTPLNGTEA